MLHCTIVTLLHSGWKSLININIFFSFATMGRERKSKLWFMRKLLSTLELEKTRHAAFNITADKNMKRFILDWWFESVLENCFSYSTGRQDFVYRLHPRFACGFRSLLGKDAVPYFPLFLLCTSHAYLIFVISLHRQNFWRMKFTPKTRKLRQITQ